MNQLNQYKIFSIILIGILLGTLGERTWNHIYAQDPFIGRVLKSASAHPYTILIGDSVCVSTFKTDHDQRDLGDMLQDDIGSPLLNAGRSGMPLTAQKYLLELMLALKIKSPSLLLEINPLQSIRAIDPVAFHEWKVHLNLIQSPMLPPKRFLLYALYLDKKLTGSVITDAKDFLLPCSSIENITFFRELFSEVLDLLPQLSHNSICFIPPMDMSKVQSKFSIESVDLLHQLREETAKICAAKGIVFRDFHNWLPDSQYFPDAGYIDIYWVHLNDVGRQLFSRELAGILKQME